MPPQLGVAATHLPRWATFAVLGFALVTFSATYERQLRRLAAARQRLTLLREAPCRNRPG